MGVNYGIVNRTYYIGRETMSPSLQEDKLGSKIRPKSEVEIKKPLNYEGFFM